MVGLPVCGQRQHNKMVADRPRREGKVTAGKPHREDKVEAYRLRREGKAALGRSREGSTTASQRQQKENRLRGGRSIFAVQCHRGRERAERSKSRDLEEDCRNSGAAAQAAADWNDEELWMSALEEAGIDWNGSLQEFSESAMMGERARALWEEGAEGRTAAAFRDAFILRL